jgi:DNA polymerase I
MDQPEEIPIMSNQKLLLIDGNAVLHRAYYALPDWRNQSGEATAGVYGFLSMTIKAIQDLNPTHLIVVFDHPSPTFRHTMYVGYQHNREKDRQVSEDIWGQVEKLKEILDKMGVPVFQTAGFEADDVIGTLATQVTSTPHADTPHRLSPKIGERESKGKTEVVIITGDRDLMQLVNKQVKLYMPIKGITDVMLVDEEKVKERMGVRADQIIDYKALVGDSSDNYPGVTGIGPTTTNKLLEEYGTVENIYKNLDKLPEKLKLKLAEGYESAKLSEELATIRRDVPVTMELENSVVPTVEKILEVIADLGYKSLVKRLGGEDNSKKAKEDDKQEKLF